MTTRATKYMPTLVVNMVGEFDAQELVEFLSFLGMLAHKLNVSWLLYRHCFWYTDHITIRMASDRYSGHHGPVTTCLVR
jgi:hypothetical protein